MTKRKRTRRAGPGAGDAKARPLPHKHALYEACFAGVVDELAFVEGIYRLKRGRLPRLLREDFCGTALLACDFVRGGADRRAWAVDLDLPTLDWGREQHVARLGDAASRVTLLHADVLEVEAPPVDLIVALSYSYWIFKTRDLLRAYFEKARRELGAGGIFVLDAFGGLESMEVREDAYLVEASTGAGGEAVPAFTYFCEQASFNPVDHVAMCHIHFGVPGHDRLERAFSYEWRIWTLPELRELLLEVGFGAVEVYTAGMDDGGPPPSSPDGVHGLRTRFHNYAAWNAYLVAIP